MLVGWLRFPMFWPEYERSQGCVPDVQLSVISSQTSGWGSRPRAASWVTGGREPGLCSHLFSEATGFLEDGTLSSSLLNRGFQDSLGLSRQQQDCCFLLAESTVNFK